MSLDVFVACAAAVVLPRDLPQDISWMAWDADTFSAGKADAEWIVEVWLVKDPRELEQINPPAEKPWVVGLSLGGNDDEGFALLERTYEAISTKCDGTLLD